MIDLQNHPEAVAVAGEGRDNVPLLSVRDLRVQFASNRGPVTAVDGVSFDLERGRVLGLVGESGSGKSVTALSLLKLVPSHLAWVRGEVWFEGRNLAELSERQLQSVRGREIGMIFQEPMTSLNPIASIGWQMAEPLILHLAMSRSAARDRAAELLDKVGIPRPRQCLDRYPHELSGGMRQRVMIAMALACRPKILIADEPTTALDVTTQAQILDLLRDLQAEFGTAIIMITHDLGVVAEFADDVQVMYAGRAVERAPVAEIFARPQHPYTEGLLRSIPSFDDIGSDRLFGIDGTVPSPFDLPKGCAFAPRCAYASPLCEQAVPTLNPFERNHSVACIRRFAGLAMEVAR